MRLHKLLLTLSLISSIVAFMGIFVIVLQTNTQYIYLSSSMINSKRQNYDQFALCYIKNKTQSKYGVSYSFENDGMDILKLIKYINIYDILNVFVFSNNIRQPNMDHVLCNLPFIEFKINDS
eukprot:210941_1